MLRPSQQRLRDAGMCISHPQTHTVNNTLRCQRCIDYQKEYHSKKATVLHSRRMCKNHPRIKAVADRASCEKCLRDARFKRYSMTENDFQRMLNTQQGKCAGCGEELWRELNIDHNHKTKAVRGLLCGPCNRALGSLKESPERIVGLLKYIERFA